MNIKSKITEKTLKEIQNIIGKKLTLGKLLWVIRNADDIPQVEFAKKLEMTKQHLCDVEHDRKFVSPKLAAEYAEKLGYSKEQFVRLALQGLIDRDGLNLEIEVFPKRKKKQRNKRLAA